MRTCVAVLAALVVASAVNSDDRPAPAPMTPEQSNRIRDLVAATQATASRLQAQLEERQRELATLYASYELNERQAHQVQLEIVDLQRQMLANYHRMQTELRAIVGQERFDVLRRRISQVIPPAGQKKPEPSRPPEK